MCCRCSHTSSKMSLSATSFSGGETDVCVLAWALGAVDIDYRVIIAEDALCSTSDESHDALTTLYTKRFNLQIEMAATASTLGAWDMKSD